MVEAPVAAAVQDVGPDAGLSIEPIPEEQRSLGAIDLAVLWGDLGVGLLVLVTGALLVDPAVLGMGLGPALLAIVVGSVIGVALLATAGVAGADNGVPTMVLFRPTLGIRGSWVPSALNTLQLVGWTAVEFWAMSYVANLVSERVFDLTARWLWLAVVALVCTALALWGPVGVTRVWMERFSAWVVAAIAVAVTVLVVVEGDLGGYLRNGEGFTSFGSAMDLVIAMPISWLPLVADYTRFAKRPRSAFFGTFGGYLLANVWLYSLGALLLLSSGSGSSPAGVAAGVLALTGGSIAGIVFLIGLLAGETDEAFADLYSGAVSIQNVFPKAPQRALIIAISIVAVGLAATLSMERYEVFLFLIGSVFVPLFGVFAADYFFARRRRVSAADLYRRGGRYWYRSGVRWIALVPWLAGFGLYHWIAPTGPTWWTDLTASVTGAPLAERIPWLGASIPAFASAFLLHLVLTRVSSGPRPSS